MVERSLSMREVPGSIPGASKDCFYFDFSLWILFKSFNSKYTSFPFIAQSSPNFVSVSIIYKQNNSLGSGGIRTHASEETGALNQRLRPLGHATS